MPDTTTPVRMEMTRIWRRSPLARGLRKLLGMRLRTWATTVLSLAVGGR